MQVHTNTGIQQDLNLHINFSIKSLDAWVSTVEFCIIQMNWIKRDETMFFTSSLLSLLWRSSILILEKMEIIERSLSWTA